MDLEFSISEEQHDDSAVVSVHGEIDVATAPELREVLQRLVNEGRTRIVVDLLDVGFLDSTGLGVLVGALDACREADGELRLVIGEARIRKVFEITGLSDVFSISTTVAEAVAS
jgi:anti-sigma B factor antagonist